MNTGTINVKSEQSTYVYSGGLYGKNYDAATVKNSVNLGNVISSYGI